MDGLDFMEKVGALTSTPTFDGEHLERMGRQAARMSMADSIPITDAVVKVAGEHPGLTRNHIENVCWFANINRFRKEASDRKAAKKDYRHEFDPADPTKVAALLDSAGVEVVEVGAADYSGPPDKALTVQEPVVDKLAEVFQIKTAEARVGEPRSTEEPLNPYGNAWRVVERIKGAAAEMRDTVAALEVRQASAEAAFSDTFRQTIRDGGDYGTVLEAVQRAGCTERVKTAASHVTKVMVDMGELSRGKVQESLTKTASAGVLNPEHPLVQTQQELSRVEGLYKQAQLSLLYLAKQRKTAAELLSRRLSS